MKKLYFLFGLFVCLTGCENWLDVSPKTEVKEDELFAKEAGYKTALLGAYIQMASSDLYGGNLTMGFMDVLAQYYSITAEKSTYMAASTYDYAHSDVKPIVTRIWSDMYYIIANLNNLLMNMEQNKEIFTGNNYSIIKGEALGLRAYLHFDLLRMYAPSYAVGKDLPTIPYVDRVAHIPFEPLSVKQLAESCIRDLVEAESLLKETDPIGPAFESYSEKYVSGATDNAEYGEDGGFLRYRSERMNYYAVITTIARIYLYIDDKEKALEYAKIAASTNRCPITGMTFQLYSDKVTDYSELYFNPNLEEEEQLIITGQKRESIYENDRYGSIDNRSKDWFNYYPNSSTEFLSKYMKLTNQAPVNIPLIRGCEAYYIAAEASGDYSWINQVRNQFGISAVYDLQEGTDDLEQELYKEYTKTFVGEGQLFYFMKRNNLTGIPGVAEEQFPELYTFPLPDNELEFGNVAN